MRYIMFSACFDFNFALSSVPRHLYTWNSDIVLRAWDKTLIYNYSKNFRSEIDTNI